MAYDRNNVFARILRGELPSSKVYEDEHVLAFRDIHPQAPTHIVLIPKGEYVSIDDFSEKASAQELAAFLRAIAKVAHQEGVAASGYRILSNHGAAAHQDHVGVANVVRRAVRNVEAEGHERPAADGGPRPAAAAPARQGAGRHRLERRRATGAPRRAGRPHPRRRH